MGRSSSVESVKEPSPMTLFQSATVTSVSAM